MTKIRLPYIQEQRERSGKVNRYFRRRGCKLVPLPGLPGSAEFMAAYQAALAMAPLEIGASRTKPGTINALAVRYYASAEFTTLAPITKSTYRNRIERFRAEHGDKPVAGLKREHVRALIDARAATPSAANNFLAMVGLLMRFAVDLGWRDDDPTFRLKKVRLPSSSGWHSWTEPEIAQFEARHPLGSKARLALDLMLYTAQRRSDVIRMGPQHVEGDVIKFRQQKTGAELEIPILPELAASLTATPVIGTGTFLVTGFGKPFAPAGFGNWFREQCDAADLPQCSAHGLRKAAARRLADAGCGNPEIKAVTGHRTEKEVGRYTRGADQKRNARSAYAKLVRAKE